jgi:hypothetical protein
MLIEAGHQVTGSTRSPARAIRLSQVGATPAVVDGLDRQAVIAAVRAAQPDVIVHQMTALASLRNFRRFDAEFAVTNELRTRGTDYLLEAGRQAGTRRFVVQSFTGWNNARTAGPVTSEDEPLHPHPLPVTAQTISDAMLETVRKRKLPVVGEGTGIWSFVEVSDAAAATGAWLPYLSSCLGVKPPVHVPAWLGKLLAGELVVSLMTVTRGVSNAKARRELGWTPRYPSWRDGFPAWTAARQEAHASAA